MFEPSPEQFGVFWDFLMQPDVTDVDYNGSALWITDLKKGKYRAKEAEEKVTENFFVNCGNYEKFRCAHGRIVL